MHLRYSAAFLVAAAFAAAACGGIVDPSSNQVETFTGQIAVGGRAVHGFSAGKTGEISVKITALSPANSNTFVGIVWTGRASDGTCNGQLGALFGQNNLAQLNVPAISAQILQGGYCLTLFDVGSFTTTTSYSVQVSHPM
jgi:hypothetical protein